MLPFLFRDRKSVPILFLLTIPLCLAYHSPVPAYGITPVKYDSIHPLSKTQWELMTDTVQLYRDSLYQRWKQRRRASSLEDINHLYQLHFRVQRLDSTLATLKRLVNSPYTYAVQIVSANGIGGTVYDPEIKAIVFRIGLFNRQLFVHEITHGGQFENGKLVFNKTSGNMAGDDVDDELEAYYAAYAIDPDDFPPLEQINASWLWKQKANNDKFFYNVNEVIDGNTATGLIPVSVNSDSAECQRAFPCNTKPWVLEFPMRDSTNFIFCLPKSPPSPPSKPSSLPRSR